MSIVVAAGHILTFIGANLLLNNMNYILQMYNPEMALRQASCTILGNNKSIPQPTLDSSLINHSMYFEENEIREQAEEIALLYYIVYISLAGYDQTNEFNTKLNSNFLWDYKTMSDKVTRSCMVLRRVNLTFSLMKGWSNRNFPWRST